MPLPVIAGVTRCAFSGALPGGATWTNVLHARFTGGASSPGPSDIVALDTLLTRLYSGTAFGSGAAWLTNCISAVTLTKASYTVLNGTALGQDIVKALAGTVGGASLPSECAAVLTIRSAQRGRSHRGRIYLPCCSTGVMAADGTMGTVLRSATVAQWAGLQTALGGASVAPFWELGVASYLLGVFTPSTAATMDAYMDVQTRRRN